MLIKTYDIFSESSVKSHFYHDTRDNLHSGRSFWPFHFVSDRNEFGLNRTAARCRKRWSKRKFDTPKHEGVNTRRRQAQFARCTFIFPRLGSLANQDVASS